MNGLTILGSTFGKTAWQNTFLQWPSWRIWLLHSVLLHMRSVNCTSQHGVVSCLRLTKDYKARLYTHRVAILIWCCDHPSLWIDRNVSIAFCWFKNPFSSWYDWSQILPGLTTAMEGFDKWRCARVDKMFVRDMIERWGVSDGRNNDAVVWPRRRWLSARSVVQVHWKLGSRANESIFLEGAVPWMISSKAHSGV